MKPVQSNVTPTNDHSYPAQDYPVAIGTGLVACKDGVIRDMPNVPTRILIGYLQNGQAWPNAGGGSPNSGNVINIDHGGGEWTSYLHDSPFDVNALRGKAVKQGQVFAKSGHNGWSTGPHLHFEVWKNGVRVDPQKWLDSIKPGRTDIMDEPSLNYMHYDYLGRTIDKNSAGGQSFLKQTLGKPFLTARDILSQHPEYLARVKKAQDYDKITQKPVPLDRGKTYITQ